MLATQTFRLCTSVAQQAFKMAEWTRKRGCLIVSTAMGASHRTLPKHHSIVSFGVPDSQSHTSLRITYPASVMHFGIHSFSIVPCSCSITPILFYRTVISQRSRLNSGTRHPRMTLLVVTRVFGVKMMDAV